MTISLNGTSTNYEPTKICFNFNFLPNGINKLHFGITKTL